MLQFDRRLAELTPEEHTRLKKLLGLEESLGTTIDRFTSERDAAITSLGRVISEHPVTPWSVVARSQKVRDVGLKFRSYFQDPRYQEIGKRIKVLIF